MRLHTKAPPEMTWAWVARYPYETSLVVVCGSQTLALVTIYTAGLPIGNHAVPAWFTLGVAAMFAFAAVFLAAAICIGTAGIVATALRVVLVALLCLAGMVLPNGVAGPEAVLLAQLIPYLILTAARACYVEKVWKTRVVGEDQA